MHKSLVHAIVVAATLSGCATVASAQLPDSVVWGRLDSLSICPQVFVKRDAGMRSWNIETSPITTRVGGRDLAMVMATSFLPAGLGTLGVVQFVAMGEGPPRYSASHDIVILAEDSIRITAATKYKDNAPSPSVHFETIAGQLHSYDLARLAKVKRITVTLGTEPHSLSTGQVQAVRALVRAMGEPLSEREVATGCTGPNRSELEAKWERMNRSMRPGFSGTTPRILRPGDSSAGPTYFEFQVTKPATVSNHGVMLYPPELMAAKVSGRVLAQFIVLEDGTADMDTFKILSSTNDLFTRSVRLTVPTMHFSPAEVRGRKVRQLVQLPFDYSLNRVPPDTVIPRGAVLPVSLSQTVYTEAQVDKPVRELNGSPLHKALPPAVIAMFGEAVVLEFVVNADGSVDHSTIRVVSASTPQLGNAVVKGFSARYRPAELTGKSVRQFVRVSMPVSISRAPK